MTNSVEPAHSVTLRAAGRLVCVSRGQGRHAVAPSPCW